MVTDAPCTVVTEAPGAWAIRYGGPAGALLLVLSQVALARHHVVPACGILLLYFLIGGAYQRVHRWMVLVAWGLLAGAVHSGAGAIWLAAREGLAAGRFGHPANVAGGRALLLGCVELYVVLGLVGVALVFLEAAAQANVEIKIKT